MCSLTVLRSVTTFRILTLFRLVVYVLPGSFIAKSFYPNHICTFLHPLQGTFVNHSQGYIQNEKVNHFRILIIGSADVGKTTILEKVCQANGQPPIVLGEQIILTEPDLKSSAKALKRTPRGTVFDIEAEFTYPTLAGFVFHMSWGFDGDTSNELKKVKSFIDNRAIKIRVDDRLHAIWYCLSTSSDRPLTRAELSLFQISTGNVPVIVVFTKMDLLEKKAFDELRNQGKSFQDAILDKTALAKDKFQRHCLNQLQGVSHRPAHIVQLRDLNKPGTSCVELIKKTSEALEDSWNYKSSSMMSPFSQLQALLRTATASLPHGSSTEVKTHIHNTLQFHKEEKIEMTSFWIAAEHALHHVQENRSQIEAVFATHDIRKSEYVLYAGFDESLIHTEVGYLEQIHVFSSASVIAASLLSQLGKIFSPFSSFLFTQSTVFEIPVYKPDGTTWIFDELVFQTAFKLVDQGSTATATPTVISTCTASRLSASNPSSNESPKKPGSSGQEKGEDKKRKSKGKASDDEMGDRDNEDNTDDNSSEDSDSDDPDDKKPENQIEPPAVLFDVVSQMIVNQDGLQKRFQVLGVRGQIMIQVEHYPSHSNFDIEFAKLNFDTGRATVNTGYEQIHLRVTVDPQEQDADANVIQPRQTSASDGEIKGVSGSKTSWAQTSSIAASLRFAPQATITAGSSRITETSGTTEKKQYTSQITEQTLYGVVRWGFQIDDESDRKGGIKIPGSKLPHASFDFYPKFGSVNPTPAPSFVDVEVASYWSLISPAKQGLKWFTDLFAHSQINDVVYSNICQAVVLKIPSKLMKRSSYKATLKVNLADPDLRSKTTVRVMDGEIGPLVEISGADHFTPADHGLWTNESLLDLPTLESLRL